MIADSRLAAVMAGLEDSASARVAELGSQVFVSLGGVCILDMAFGTDGGGAPLETGSVLAQYCSLKPTLAVAVLELLDEDDLSCAVSSFVPALPADVGDLTPAELLAHSAALGEPSGLLFRSIDYGRRLEAIASEHRRMVRAGLWNAYSECGAWYVLGLVAEEVADAPLSEVFSATGSLAAMEDEWWLCSEESGTTSPVAVGASFHPRHGWQPRLAELSAVVQLDWNPGFGGFASTRALGRFYESLLGAPHGELKARLAKPQRVGEHDWVLDRRCDFGRGVMIGLESHGFGSLLSEGAFGHSGYSGQSFGFADPELGLAVAFSSIGCSDPELAVSVRRPQMIDRIVESLGLVRGR